MAPTRNLTRREFLRGAGIALTVLPTAARASGLKAQPPGLITSVRRVGGVPTFVCNGRPVLKPAFETYAPTRHYFEQFAGAGTRIFGFSTNAAACDYGHSKPTWVDADTWDHSQFEQRGTAVLEALPNALLLPRVNLGTPRWWLEEHPEALEKFDDGSTIPVGTNPTLPKDRPFPSLASPVWRSAVGEALRRFVRHVRDSRFGPHIFGWCLAGMHTEEFYHWACNTERLAGYSRATEAAFRAWLRRTYRDVPTLRRAWGRNDVDFETACVPSRQERLDCGDGVFRRARQRNVVDFYLFWNELIPETIDHFAGIIKQTDGGRHVVGAFYGYLYEFAGDPEFGHNAAGRFLNSEHLEFMAVTASYFTRQSGAGGDYARSPAASAGLHGKLWYHDNDVVSFLARRKMEAAGWRDDDPDWTRNLSVQLRSLGYTDTAQKSRWMYRRGLGFALCHGMFQAWFDLHGGYFDAPELMSEIETLNRLAAEAASWNRSSVAEILVIADEASCAWCRPRSPLLRQTLLAPQNQLIRLGAPADHILLDDLGELDTNPYKLIVFLNCFRVTADQRDVIARELKRDGKHLLWCSAAGWFADDGGSAEHCHDLTGFTLIRSTDAQTPVRLAGDAGRKSVDGNDGAVEIGVHEENGWTSLFAPTAALPASCFRALAKAAGVHLYNEQDDVLYACRSLLCLHARDDGQHAICFPAEVELRDAVTGEFLGTGIRRWKQPFKAGETALLHWRQLE